MRIISQTAPNQPFRFMRHLLLVTIVLLAVNALAQQVSHATFYSKEGYPFTIYLNGQKMNDVPQTEVRLINLTQPYYSCEAVFEDASVLVSKRMPDLHPVFIIIPAVLIIFGYGVSLFSDLRKTKNALDGLFQ